MEKILHKVGAIVDLVLRAMGLAMGVAAAVMSLLGFADTDTMITLLAIGLFGLGVASLSEFKDEALDEI